MPPPPVRPAPVNAPRPRIAVLASGSGSNLQALLDAIGRGVLPAEIVGVFSDRPAAPALLRVPEALRWSLDAATCPDRAVFDQVLADAVSRSQPDWVVCAGYMRILGATFVERFRGRLVNIHPSLLPRHRGLRTHARALAAGDVRHGASIHFVIPELDAGNVIAQVEMPILADDSAQTLAARLLPREHALMVAVAQLLVSGRLSEHDGKALVDGHPLFSPMRLDLHGTLAPPPEELPE